MPKRENPKTALRNIAYLAIVGAISLTSCYANTALVQKPVENETVTIVQTEPIIPKYTVKGVTFHDYNGDGIHQEIEPLVPGVFLRFSATDNVTTNEKGEYNLKLDPGTYTLSIPNGDSVIGYHDQPFKGVSISKEDFKMIGDYSKTIDLENDLGYDIGLVQGFLTLPFRPDAKFLISDYLGIGQYVDEVLSIGV